MSTDSERFFGSHEGEAESFIALLNNRVQDPYNTIKDDSHLFREIMLIANEDIGEDNKHRRKIRDKFLTKAYNLRPRLLKLAFEAQSKLPN